MQATDLSCIICGEPSNGYHFCKKCWKKYNEGIIDLRIYNCSESEILEDEETECLLCGEPANGYHFCYDCYQKVRNGADLRIAPGGTEAKIIDPYGNKEYEADNGITVRSKGEVIILNCLWKKHVRAIYEKPVMIGDETFRPDFYLPDQNLYIEYNGLDDPGYLKRKEETLKKYKKRGLNVVVLTDDEVKKINQVVDFILEKCR